MLNADDTPTIRNAIIKRLDREPGVVICDLKFEKAKFGDWYAVNPHKDNSFLLMCEAPFVRVRLESDIGLPRTLVSYFDLPVPFEHSDLLNHIDEIAEQYKAARLSIAGRGGLLTHPERQLDGSGLRGRWASYG